jgi:threonine dehydrogenase-like Zn-dependent dehydrogenase
MSQSNDPRALWFTAPGKAEIRREVPQEGDVRIRTLWTGISRGTERLVFEGRVPIAEYDAMRAPYQCGSFRFPVKYGYCAVGRVTSGPPALDGCTVFALHPHQDRFALPESAVLPLPDGLPPRRAVLAANMETALNGIWDGGIGPGDRIAVVGGGAVGLMVAALAAAIPGTSVWLVEIDPCRRAIAEALGARFALPDAAPEGCDAAFHVSASAAGLATALGTLGMEGTLVELSWHGTGATPVPLGGAFHARRLRLVSSQVGTLPAVRRPRWDHRRRLAKALDLLAAMPALDALITEEVAFDDLPSALPRLLAPGAPGIATAVRYP